MSKRRQFEIEASPSNFTFDVEGDFFPTAQLVHNEATEAPTVAEVRYSWEISGTIKAADLTEDTTWADFNAFVAIVSAREAPTYVRMVRDPSGAAEEVWKLDGSTYEQLRIEEFEVFPDDSIPGAQESHWVTHAHVRLRVSAVKKNADANGIAGWDQRTTYSAVNGQRVIEWRTRVTTVGGSSPVDAEAKARTFAVIDVTTLSDSTWAYQTGNTVTDGGVEIQIIDADERAGASRVPTVVEAVCRVAQQGLTVGATGAGSAPNSIVRRVETSVDATETETITTAEVAGPNAETAGLALKPAGELSESSQIVGTDNTFSGRWVRKTASTTATNNRLVKVELSGGQPVVRTRVISGGHEPLKQVGGLLPFMCKVTVTVLKTGGTGTNAEMLLPPLLPAPWFLDPLKSTEGGPVIEEKPAKTTGQNKWVRSAVLVYMATSPPSRSPVALLAESTDSVESYLLPGAA